MTDSSLDRMGVFLRRGFSIDSRIAGEVVKIGEDWNLEGGHGKQTS